MLTRNQADKIRNLHNDCILSEIAVFNAKESHEVHEVALKKNSLAKYRFNKYVESLVKDGDRNLDWIVISGR